MKLKVLNYFQVGSRKSLVGANKQAIMDALNAHIVRGHFVD